MPAYNNYFPMGYQPIQYQPPVQFQPPVVQPQQQNSTGIIWVQGEAGAKAYPVAPGNSILLMDSENSFFYIKSTDTSGVPQPIRKFKYEEYTGEPKKEEPKQPEIDLSNFVTKEELDERFANLTLTKTPPKTTRKD